MAEAQNNKAADDKKATDSKSVEAKSASAPEAKRGEESKQDENRNPLEARSAMNPEETQEERLEAFDTTESRKVQDGRGIDLATGKIAAGSGAEIISFNQTRLKVVNGHTVLTDHVKGQEKLIDIQKDAVQNPDASDAQWRA